MHAQKAFGAAILLAGTVVVYLHAQVPPVPGVPPTPALPGTPTAPATAAAAAAVTPGNIWSKLCPTAAQCEQCKQKFCNSALGKMFTALTMPVSMFSGGLLGSCCPVTPLGQLAPGTPDGVASKIAADEAAAKARRADMRYLGTVDCHYWPEAEAALIAGLRTDKNECVRWEAAISLGKGCCCTKKTIEALRLVIIGSEQDGNPAETSDRVKAAAMSALQHCLCCYREKAPETPKERPTAAQTPAAPVLPAYYVKLENEPAEPILTEARQLVERLRRGEAGRLTVMPTGGRSVSHILTRAKEPPTTVAQTREPAAARTHSPVATTASPPVRRDLYHWLKGCFQPAPILAEPPLASDVTVVIVSGEEEGSYPIETVVPARRDLMTLLRNAFSRP